MVVGPGLGQSRHAADTLARAISRPLPLILDADALNLLALEPALVQRLQNRAQPTLLTPHPAEAARLLQTSTGVIQGDRLAAAKQIAGRLHAAVALKAPAPCAHFRMGTGRSTAAATRDWRAAEPAMRSPVFSARWWRRGWKGARAMQLAVCVHGAAADVLVAGGTGPGRIDGVGARAGGATTAERSQRPVTARLCRTLRGRAPRVAS
jgi:hypothetical protein